MSIPSQEINDFFKEDLYEKNKLNDNKNIKKANENNLEKKYSD